MQAALLIWHGWSFLVSSEQFGWDTVRFSFFGDHSSLLGWNSVLMSDGTLQFAVNGGAIYFFSEGVFPFFMVTVLCWDEIVSWCLKVNSLVRLQSVFPFLVITFLCWDEIVSWCLSSELWTVRDQYILLEFSKVHEKLDGHVFSLVFFDVTAPSLLFGERFSLVFFDVTAVIIQHSSLIIRHSSFVIHHSYINQQSIKNQSKINQK